MRYILIAVFTLLLAVPGWADENNSQSGYVWRDSSATAKVYYVVGVLNGASLLEFSECGEGKFQKIASIDQYVDGMDQFYEDFRNRHVSLMFAFSIVNQQLHGASEEKIEKAIKDVRELQTKIDKAQ